MSTPCVLVTQRRDPESCAVLGALARHARVEVLLARDARADAHPDHWQKSLSPEAGEVFEQRLAAIGADLVLVRAWRGFTRDLVARAARRGIPAIVRVDDDDPSCLLGDRVRPRGLDDAGARCERSASAGDCLPCAQADLATPWVPLEARWMAFAARERDLARERELAAVVLDPSEAAGVEWPTILERALASRPLAGGAGRAPAAPTWFDERMARFELKAWDEARARHEGGS